MKSYFSHDEGARNDPKLVQVMMELGHEGKSVYWDLVEMLYEQEGYLMLSQCKGYAFALRTDCDLILKLVKDFGLFKDDGEKFWSESALRRLAQRTAKSDKAKESAAKRWSKTERNANALPPQSEGNAIKVKEIKGNKSDVVKEVIELSVVANNVARDTALATTDVDDEQTWDQSPMTKPHAFKAICDGNDFVGIDYEHYRIQLLDAAQSEKPPRKRTSSQWRSWVRITLTNRSNKGGLRKLDAAMPTEPTPRHLLPAPGQETKGQVIAVRGDHDQVMNRLLIDSHQANWPTAIIHAIRP